MTQARSARGPAAKSRSVKHLSLQFGGPPRRIDLRTLLILTAMMLAVLAVYVPVPAEEGQNTLVGLDYLEMHLHRIRFAQEALFGPHPHLPSWYPRELLGTPFWSNAQDFPFLPTRLLLLACDPLDALAVGVNLAAVLAALFTFLYARRIGLWRISSAAAGWTFACAGFFASRIMAGHLPLLEAYPALPLLLWLVERWFAADPRVETQTPGTPGQSGAGNLDESDGPNTASPRIGSAPNTDARMSRFAAASRTWSVRGVLAGGNRSLELLALGLACGCVALAGHPQLPIYAIAAAALYAFYRAGVRQGARAVAAMGAGVLSAGFALWPLWRLVERSARMLALDPSDNDIAFPCRRLVAFLFPWSQGWSAAVDRTPWVPFTFPNEAYFWETVCYVGWLPLLAAGFLLIRAVIKRKPPAGPWLFIASLAVAALLLALPAARAPLAHLPGTFLHSPARMLYFTAFGLALGLGAAGDVLLAWAVARRQRWVLGILALALAAHLVDLGRHDRQFIRMVPFNATPTDGDIQFARQVGVGRVAIDGDLYTPLNRRLDDIGYFDSIALAKPYAALLDLGGKSPTYNTQYLNGSDLNDRALASCGVKFLVTKKTLAGSASSEAPLTIPIPDPALRASFYARTQAIYLDRPAIHQRLRDPQFDLRQWVMLPPETRSDAASRPAQATLPGSTRPAKIDWQRDSEDQVTIEVENGEAGYIRWLEAWDPGWQATVDGAPALLLPADDVFMAIPLPPGTHIVRLTFTTPGALTGWLISAAGLLSLIAIAFWPFR